MKRDTRALIAKETVAICEAGSYVAPSGARVSIRGELQRAKESTVIYSPENPPVVKAVATLGETRFEARNESTFAALARLSPSAEGHLACLNFASARNPGGGFLNGALAQEEALASASGLYPCLLMAREYYERNRANKSALYLDLAIFSSLVPFFRNDLAALLDRPILASVITAPAPNAGAVAQNEPANLNRVVPTLRRRVEFVLSIAAAHRVTRLVLGAWGCGVFRNDPRVVAKAFTELLMPSGKFAKTFAKVVFAVLDRSDGAASYQAFADCFGGTA